MDHIGDFHIGDTARVYRWAGWMAGIGHRGLCEPFGICGSARISGCQLANAAARGRLAAARADPRRRLRAAARKGRAAAAQAACHNQRQRRRRPSKSRKRRTRTDPTDGHGSGSGPGEVPRAGAWTGPCGLTRQARPLTRGEGRNPGPPKIAWTRVSGEAGGAGT
jgi:hypothetical protein